MTRKSVNKLSNTSSQESKIRRNKEMNNNQPFKQRKLALVPRRMKEENSNFEVLQE